MDAKPGEAVKSGEGLVPRDVLHLVNQYLTMVGSFLALRDLLSSALNDVLKRRVPFLMSCISGLEKPDQRPVSHYDDVVWMRNDPRLEMVVFSRRIFL